MTQLQLARKKLQQKGILKRNEYAPMTVHPNGDVYVYVNGSLNPWKFPNLLKEVRRYA